MTGVDGNAVEFLKRGGDHVVDWLARIFTVCMDHGYIPEFWQDICIVPLYTGSGDKDELSNCKIISLGVYLVSCMVE